MNWVDERTSPTDQICQVAYNGARFDFPFLLACCKRYNVLVSPQIIYSLDPLKIGNNILFHPIPSNKKLATMYQHASKTKLVNAHTALANVMALLVVLLHPPIWCPMILYS